MVSELTSSGAVRLETLDGAQMPNFINGSRLKKYELPLTKEMLNSLHRAKTYKQGQLDLKERAQQEARERRHKIKARNQANIMALSLEGEDESEELAIDPFTLHLQLLSPTKETSTTALIDSGADCNVMSYETWESLGKPELTQSKLSFKNFSGTQTASLGKLYIKARIQDQPIHVVFHVANKQQASVNVVLGRQWIGATNCQIDWTSRKYSLQVNSVSLTGLSSELKTPPKQAPKSPPSNEASPSNTMPHHHEPVYWIQDAENPTHGWRATQTSLHNQGYGRGESSAHQYWVPKEAYTQLPAHFQQRAPTVANATTPKRPKTKSPKTNLSTQQTNRSTKQVWVPKGQKPSSASTKPPQCAKATK